MKTEKVEVSAKPATQAGIDDFMQGENYQHGGRFDPTPTGMGSGVHGPQLGANDVTILPPEEPQQDDYVPQRESSSEDDFKQKYGEALNEKGEWRKTAQEAMAELQNVKAEMNAMRAAQYQQAAPQPAQYPQYGAVPTPQADVPDTFFPEKSDGDLVEVGDVNRMVQSVIAPAVQQLYQQQMAIQQAQNQSAKSAAGITPAVEQRLTQSYAWLQQMPDGPQKIDAMTSLLRSEQTSKRQEEAVGRQQAQPQHPAQAAARRVTYVENAAQTSARNEQETMQQRVAREFMEAKTASEKKKVLMKYGMGQYNDFGPDFYTR